MTTSLETKRQLRTQLMNWAYQHANGSQDALLQPEDLRESFLEGANGANESELRDAIRYLEGEYLIKAHWVMGGLPSFQLTHHGIIEVEQAQSHPTQPTEHFVPLVSVVNVQGSVVGSQILQGSPGANQAMTNIENEAYSVRLFVREARKLSNDPKLDDRDRDKLDADLAFVEKELARPDPRFHILRAFGRAIREILVAGLGETVGHTLSKIPWP